MQKKFFKIGAKNMRKKKFIKDAKTIFFLHKKKIVLGGSAPRPGRFWIESS